MNKLDSCYTFCSTQNSLSFQFWGDSDNGQLYKIYIPMEETVKRNKSSYIREF